MKYKFCLIFAISAAALIFGGCKGSGFGSAAKEENFDKDASYALGMNIGTNLTQDGIVPNIDEFIKGVKDSISGKKTRFDENEAIEKIQAAYYAMMEKKEAEAAAKGDEELEKGNAFLAENSKKSGRDNNLKRTAVRSNHSSRRTKAFSLRPCAGALRGQTYRRHGF